MTHDDLVRELRERHSNTSVEETADGRLERCNLCSEWWPCDAIRAADEIERLRDGKTKTAKEEPLKQGNELPPSAEQTEEASHAECSTQEAEQVKVALGFLKDAIELLQSSNKYSSCSELFRRICKDYSALKAEYDGLLSRANEDFGKLQDAYHDCEKLRLSLSSATENLERAWKAGWNAGIEWRVVNKNPSERLSADQMQQRDLAALRDGK